MSNTTIRTPTHNNAKPLHLSGRVAIASGSTCNKILDGNNHDRTESLSYTSTSAPLTDFSGGVLGIRQSTRDIGWGYSRNTAGELQTSFTEQPATVWQSAPYNYPSTDVVCDIPLPPTTPPPLTTIPSDNLSSTTVSSMGETTSSQGIVTNNPATPTATTVDPVAGCGQISCPTPAVQDNISAPCDQLCSAEDQNRCQAFINDDNATGGTTFARALAVTSEEALDCLLHIPVDGGRIIMLSNDIILDQQVAPRFESRLLPIGKVALIGDGRPFQNRLELKPSGSLLTSSVIRLCTQTDDPVTSDCQPEGMEGGFYLWGVELSTQIENRSSNQLNEIIRKDENYKAPLRITKNNFNPTSQQSVFSPTRYIDIRSVQHDTFIMNNFFNNDRIDKEVIWVSCIPAIQAGIDVHNCVDQARITISNNTWRADKNREPEPDEGSAEVHIRDARAIRLTNIPKATVTENVASPLQGDTDAYPSAAIEVVFNQPPKNAGYPDYTLDMELDSNIGDPDAICAGKHITLEARTENKDPIPLAGMISITNNDCYQLIKRIGFERPGQCLIIDTTPASCTDNAFQCHGSLTINSTTTEEPTEAPYPFICDGFPTNLPVQSATIGAIGGAVAVSAVVTYVAGLGITFTLANRGYKRAATAAMVLTCGVSGLCDIGGKKYDVHNPLGDQVGFDVGGSSATLDTDIENGGPVKLELYKQ